MTHSTEVCRAQHHRPTSRGFRWKTCAWQQRHWAPSLHRSQLHTRDREWSRWRPQQVLQGLKTTTSALWMRPLLLASVPFALGLWAAQSFSVSYKYCDKIPRRKRTQFYVSLLSQENVSALQREQAQLFIHTHAYRHVSSISVFSEIKYTEQDAN